MARMNDNPDATAHAMFPTTKEQLYNECRRQIVIAKSKYRRGLGKQWRLVAAIYCKIEKEWKLNA